MSSDGLRLAWFPLSNGAEAPIILQHGYSANTEEEWITCGIADGLAALGRPIISIDARGHGLSEKSHDPARYGEARMAKDLSELVDHLGLTAFDLVGYSMGAIISILVATQDRRVGRLAIGGVGEAVVLLGGVDTRVLDNRTLAAAMRAEDPSDLPAFVRLFREAADARGNDRLALAAQADVVHASPIAFENVKVPTLLIDGQNDPLAVRPAVLADAITGARLVMVPGDHGGALRSPEFLAALLDFLG